MALGSRKAVLTAIVVNAVPTVLKFINELEADIKARLPRVDHITIEVEGIVAAPLEETAAYLSATQA